VLGVIVALLLSQNTPAVLQLQCQSTCFPEGGHQGQKVLHGQTMWAAGSKFTQSLAAVLHPCCFIEQIFIQAMGARCVQLPICFFKY